MRKQNDCKKRFTTTMKEMEGKKPVLMQLKPTSAPHAGTQKIFPRGPNFCQESPPPPGCLNGLGRCVSEILPGITPYGSGGREWFSVAEAQRSDTAIPADTIGKLGPY